MCSESTWDGKQVMCLCQLDRIGAGLSEIDAATVEGMILRSYYRGDHSLDVIECGNGTVFNVMDLSYWRFAE